ncbi:MAG: acyltransferase [Gammaproteobacteria bacterium]|nr:acyltransferase [Gammaproteobacteria bacterium]MBU1776233.1 acyltransferase [Gammaproteobacteria bacterium]
MFHLTSIESKYGGGGVILPAWLDFGQFGVDLFFVISGFVMMVVTSNRSGRMEANRFLYHRVTRIYPLYWFYSALLLAVLFVKPSWVIGSHDRIIDIPASFLLLPQDTYPLLSVGWTLIHEMYFYLMFFAVVRLAPAGNRMQLLTAWLLAVVILNLLSLSGSATYSLTTNPMTLEFLCGCLIAQYGSVMKDALKYSLPIVAVLSAMLAIIAFLSYRDATGIVGPTGWWRILIFGLPAGMIVLSAVRAEQSGMLMWPFLRRIGDASYSIYLSHILVLALLGKIWGQFALQGVSDNLVVLPVMLLLTLAAGDLSFRYIEQPMLRVCRKWY